MEEQLTRLTKKAWSKCLKTPNQAKYINDLTSKIAKYKALTPDKRLLVAVTGVPGSGKTTLAKLIVSQLNSLAAEADSSQDPVAILLPMDGFHYTRAKLDTFPDPAEAHARRGAPFTFDAEAFVDTVRRVRTQGLTPNSESTGVSVPSFSHKTKDPVDDAIHILPQNRVVVFEGLYLALDVVPWNVPIKEGWFEELWLVEVDTLVARERLAKRHLAAGIVNSMEDGRKRAMENDEVNGEEILGKLDKSKVNEWIQSKEDGSWVTTDGG